MTTARIFMQSVTLLFILSLFYTSHIQAEDTLPIVNCDKNNSKPTITFIPFSNDRLLSSIIIKDLNQTEFTVISGYLPLISTSHSVEISYPEKWRRFDTDYLIIGNTNSSDSTLTITYKIIDLCELRLVEKQQSLTLDNNTNSLRYGAHVIADKIYEVITDHLINYQ